MAEHHPWNPLYLQVGGRFLFSDGMAEWLAQKDADLKLYAAGKVRYMSLTYLFSEMGRVQLVKDVVRYLVTISFINYVIFYIFHSGLICTGFRFFRDQLNAVMMSFPSISEQVDAEVGKAVKKVEKSLIKNDEKLLQFPELPETGLGNDAVIAELGKMNELLDAAHWEKGRVSGAVYHGGKSLLELQLKAYDQFSVANQLHPDVFPGIRKMEAEVVAMVLKLFNAPKLGCGSTSLGGTESLLLACLAAREHGKRYKGITKPEIVAPVTVHAGIDKACYYFNIKLHKVDVDPATYQVDVKKMKKLVNRNTILLVGSAPNYPHGIIDDIELISKVAVSKQIPLHVDACLGSFIVTFLERSKVHGDAKIPLFDFRVPGVTSISCDTHKYGFAPKGSSIIMYRDPKMRECQYFVQSQWTGGMYGSPTLAGSRPGALMAGCWATLVNIGSKGYTELCKDIVSATKKLEKAIRDDKQLSEHLEVLGKPLASVVAFKVRKGSKLNIYRLGDDMTEKGWHFALLQKPAALHFAFTRLSVPVVNELIADLKRAVKDQADAKVVETSDTAALYGVAGSVATAGVASRIIVAFLDTLYKL